jgi:hypothetical protein
MKRCEGVGVNRAPPLFFKQERRIMTVCILKSQYLIGRRDKYSVYFCNAYEIWWDWGVEIYLAEAVSYESIFD